MNDETAREKLAGAVPEWTGLCDEEFLYLADALLPVVREIAAEELREAARWSAGSAIDIRAVCEHLREHADALHATEAAS